MPKLTLPALLLAALALTLPAEAQEHDFARDGMLADIERLLWPSEFVYPRRSLRFATLSLAGGLEFNLDGRPLSFFAQDLGGEVQHFANAGYRHDWLCYTADGQRIWFISDGGKDDEERGQVGWVLVEIADPTHDHAHGCTAQPLAMLVPGGKVPALGMTRREIAALYDAELPAGDRYVVLFESSSEAPYITSNVTLRFEDDRVTGISLAQGSES